MYCKYCGKKISDDSIYCEYCGKQVRFMDIESLTSGDDINKSNNIPLRSEDFSEEIEKSDVVEEYEDPLIAISDLSNEVPIIQPSIDFLEKSVVPDERGEFPQCDTEESSSKETICESDSAYNISDTNVVEEDKIILERGELPIYVDLLIQLGISYNIILLIINIASMFMCDYMDEIVQFDISAIFVLTLIFAYLLLARRKKIGFFISLTIWVLYMAKLLIFKIDRLPYLLISLFLLIPLWLIVCTHKKDGVLLWRQLGKGWGFRHLKIPYIIYGIIILCIIGLIFLAIDDISYYYF